MFAGVFRTPNGAMPDYMDDRCGERRCSERRCNERQRFERSPNGAPIDRPPYARPTLRYSPPNDHVALTSQPVASLAIRPARLSRSTSLISNTDSVSLPISESIKVSCKRTNSLSKLKTSLKISFALNSLQIHLSLSLSLKNPFLRLRFLKISPSAPFSVQIHQAHCFKLSS